MKPGSQNARIVAALADGGWHTTAAIHRVAGFSRLNSRVSELRAHGYTIECRTVPGKSGPEGFEYRMLGGGGADAAERPAAVHGGPPSAEQPPIPLGGCSTGSAPALSTQAGVEQLTLEVAA